MNSLHKTNLTCESGLVYKKSKWALLKNQAGGWALILPTILLFLIIVWRPIIMGITYSFYKFSSTVPSEFVGLKNYIDVLSDSNFLGVLWNTVKYVLWSLVIGLPLPFITAVMVNEMMISKNAFKFMTYIPVVLPSVVTSLIWRFIYADGSGGLLNMVLYFFGIEPQMWLTNANLTIPLIIVSMSWNTFGSTTIIYLASLQGVDNALYEAARLDGAGFWSRIKIILMPHMRGIILLMTLKQIIGIFQILEQPMVMTGGGPNGASMSLGLLSYQYAFRYGHLDKSMALGVVSFVLLVGLTFVYFKADKKINE